MKGFELIYKNGTKYIAVIDGVTVIYLSTFNDESESIIAVSGSDYSKRKKVKWLIEQIETGDKFHIRFTDITKPSEPIQTSDLEKDFRRKTKLEQYCRLQAILTEKGVL